MAAPSPRPAGSYGMDASWVPWLWAAIGIVYLVLAGFSVFSWGAPLWVTFLVAVLGLAFLAGGALFWNASAHGKFLVWRELLDELPAPARVLDLGCGRGAVTIMTAEAFPRADVTGVDLWRSIDQSGNSPAAAEANATVNGVSGRTRFVTGDMTALPQFDGGSFDLVTASLAIHNIHSPLGRRSAIGEAWRVLSPGGRLVIVDISKVDEYIVHLRALGAALTVRRAGWRMWWSGPWMATRILIAAKPGASS
ncbi:class I SAM-dependent methyltransferase [Microbacterium sp. ASV49]|uniref:Class I SAM-dependent methyltransferase n=1 Tax=Microbacterium candidum TaxID=3041922 RepID=A0ABT7MZF9_9MICO|nr:class I SAM-dependent methyltransferase [Microbacterium sp. ASV49]MDL9979822.1 class I SAM-dependent methyltransferase [Microbacterium sp. ASV49]